MIKSLQFVSLFHPVDRQALTNFMNRSISESKMYHTMIKRIDKRESIQIALETHEAELFLLKLRHLP